MSTATQESVIIGTYLAKGTMGNMGMPGAPICHFNLIVTPSTNHVSGTVIITQAIEGPESSITVQVSGSIRKTGYGDITQIVALKGEYVVSFPPPAIGSYLARFEAHMALNNAWDGKGGFTYGNNNIEDVPVTAVKTGE